MSRFLAASMLLMMSLVLSSGMSESRMVGEEKIVGSLRAGRCSSVFLTCSIKTCNYNCCKNKCNKDYRGFNPSGFCGTDPGFRGRVCICQRDC